MEGAAAADGRPVPIRKSRTCITSLEQD